MKLEVINKPLRLDLHGFSGTAVGKDYAGTAFKLMDKMWQTVKANNLKNKGLNIWVYEPDERVFAGVELDVSPPSGISLEYKQIVLENYAHHKHIGPYTRIKKAGIEMREELKIRNF